MSVSEATLVHCPRCVQQLQPHSRQTSSQGGLLIDPSRGIVHRHAEGVDYFTCECGCDFQINVFRNCMACGPAWHPKRCRHGLRDGRCEQCEMERPPDGE